MILAAGFGERMRPLTDHTPKPLLQAGGVPLIEYHIRALVAAGFEQLVINVSHLGTQIVDFCGDGSRWGVPLAYSAEPSPLETAGGIVKALPLLGEAPFAVVNGDIWTDYDFRELRQSQPPAGGARLVMVDNPAQHPQGDFALSDEGLVQALREDRRGYTYAGIGVYCPRMFAGLAPERLRLRPLLDAAIDRGELRGEYYTGQWWDIGTPQRLAALEAQLTGV